MKDAMKKTTALLLTLCMMVSLLPVLQTTAEAATTSSTYRVAYALNGGSGSFTTTTLTEIASATASNSYGVDEGVYYTLIPTTEPTRSGYDFVGWKTDYTYYIPSVYPDGTYSGGYTTYETYQLYQGGTYFTVSADTVESFTSASISGYTCTITLTAQWEESLPSP